MDTPVRYPKKASYKPVVEQVLHSLRQAEKEDKSARKSERTTDSTCSMSSTFAVSRLPSVVSEIRPKPGDQCMRYALPDGSKLTIVRKKKSNEAMYMLRASDGRKVIVERAEHSLGMIVTDNKGNTIRTLGCDL